MPTVRVLRPFANGHHENIVHPGDEITVTEDRAIALGDLVERIAAKAAPVPDNKMAPVPANKATAAPVRRVGRPRKATR